MSANLPAKKKENTEQAISRQRFVLDYLNDDCSMRDASRSGTATVIAFSHQRQVVAFLSKSNGSLTGITASRVLGETRLVRQRATRHVDEIVSLAQRALRSLHRPDSIAVEADYTQCRAKPSQLDHQARELRIPKPEQTSISKPSSTSLGDL